MSHVMKYPAPHLRWKKLVLSLALGMSLLLVANCNGGGAQVYPPLPTGKERPLLPGCKQLRAEGGEC